MLPFDYTASPITRDISIKSSLWEPYIAVCGESPKKSDTSIWGVYNTVPGNCVLRGCDDVSIELWLPKRHTSRCVNLQNRTVQVLLLDVRIQHRSDTASHFRRLGYLKLLLGHWNQWIHFKIFSCRSQKASDISGCVAVDIGIDVFS